MAEDFDANRGYTSETWNTDFFQMAEIVEELPKQSSSTAELLDKAEDGNISPSAEISVFDDKNVASNAKLMDNISKAAKNSFLLPDAEFLKVKNYLSSSVGVKHPVSMYEHLTSIIMNSMESKNGNLVDNFEKLSLAVKNNHVAPNPNAATNVKELHEKNIENESAKLRLKLLPDENAEVGEIPDIMTLAGLWEWAGVSFGKEDTFVLYLSIKKLVQAKQLRSVRLWGKIYGREANYIVVEGELKEGIDDIEDDVANAVSTEARRDAEPKPEDGKGPKIAKPKEFAPLLKESRQGVNKYIYYVCNTVGSEWTRLPDVIPENLQQARKVQKYFSGNLSRNIESYPAFKGSEAQYLRCQIARISAATVISPKGYYIIDEDAEAPEEGTGIQPIVVNPEFEGVPSEQLTDVSNWVHHIPYILPQGKVVYEVPKEVKEPKEGEEEDEEENEESPQEPEVGPETLSAVVADIEHGNIPAWSSRVCSRMSPIKFSPILLRSNRWPGAFTLAYNDKFSNIYIGDGQKSLGNPSPNFYPPTLPNIQREYFADESISENARLLVEQTDPTVEEEKKYEDSLKPPVETNPEAGEAAENEDDAEEEAEKDEE